MSNDGNFRYDPTTETTDRITDELEEQYDVVYIDRKLGRGERAATLAERYGPHLSASGMLVFKPVYFETGLPRPKHGGGRRRRLRSWHRLTVLVPKVARMLAHKELLGATQSIYVFPRNGSLFMSNDASLLIRHIRSDAKPCGGIIPRACLLLGAGLIRFWPRLWPFRYSIVTRR
ncbi:MAG: hypothetical protein JXB62_06925 [Pirellulales bacterium]|nr:hypothetical protein [Pirellulales bacterium]